MTATVEGRQQIWHKYYIVHSGVGFGVMNKTNRKGKSFM
jgi:hypothetical protein